MPSIVPSYVYTLFACMIVGALLISASSMSSLSVKNQADVQELKNIANYVATASLKLVSSTQTNNLTSDFTFNIPATVGNQRYWLQLGNDSFRGWVNIGFGINPNLGGQRTYIPMNVSAFGDYISGAGIPVLKCYMDGELTYLEISEGT